jgi:hypothetical protein
MLDGDLDDGAGYFEAETTRVVLNRKVRGKPCLSVRGSHRELVGTRVASEQD